MSAIVELKERPRSAPCYAEAPPVRLSAEAAQHFSEDLQILAHPIRMQILDILGRSAGQVCVCDLEAALPVKQPTVSHHLRLPCGPTILSSARRWLHCVPVSPDSSTRSAKFFFWSLYRRYSMNMVRSTWEP